MSSPMRDSLLWAVVAATPAAALAQTGSDVIRGRITTETGAPLGGASVLVIQSSDQKFRSTQSDSTGRFQLVWQGGTGAYTVRFAAPGRRGFETQVRRTPGDSVIVVNATLPAGAVTLAPITVHAAAPKPDRSPPNGPETGAAEQLAFPQNAARRLPPELAGDLAAIAALANPAALPVAGGVSVLGLPPGQNSVVLNGMALPASAIPRTTGAAVRISTTSYDPANGWYGGQRTNIQLVTGRLFTTLTSQVSLDIPQAQASDPVASQLGQRYTNLDASLGADGRLLNDKFAYNLSFQGAHRSGDLASLLTASASLLEHAGIAPDSAARFRQLVQQAGVPLTASGVPGGLATDNAVFLGRLDHAPYDWNTLTAAKRTWSLTGYGSWNRNRAQALGPTATPAHAGSTTRAAGALQAGYSAYFGHDYLADFRSGIAYASSTGSPYQQLPDARVRVLSDLPDGGGGVAQLAFGGNSALSNDQHTLTWETTGQIQLYPTGAIKHRIKLDADFRYDRTTLTPGGNRLGTFTYNSLGDLAANAPASFSRILNASERHGAAWNGFVAVGDLWRASPSLQLAAGLRLEGNTFADRPAYNPAVETLFGARTDYAPNTVHLSPRLGFTWNRLGKTGRPTATIRGGIGEFRNLIDIGLLAAPSVSTGLPGGATQLTCIGSAVPAPDWTRWGNDPNAIPTQCGSATGTLADAAPQVQLIGHGFTAERSWRANLSWNSSWHNHVYTILGTWSENFDQHGTRDLNFAGAPVFSTPEGRPVFVNPASIVPGTGVVSAVDARTSNAYGRVVSAVADLRSRARQLTFIVRPSIRLGNRIGDPLLAYTIGTARSRARGFDAPTFDSPVDAEWARSDLDVRHQFQLQTVFRPFGNFGVLLFIYGRLQSGLPYTPLVGSDVNGDALPNDRAFVFDPARATDPALADGMRALLTNAPASVQRCLARQLNQPASRDSCETPWTAALNLSLRLSGQQLLHLPRLDLTVNFANPLGGIDQLAHGSAHLHGWGAPATPDPVLYTVHGFDPATHSFRYEVNPRFGNSQPQSSTLRAPFRMTVTASLDLGRSIPAQQLDRWLLPGRAGHPGERIGKDALRRRLERQVPDPYAELLGQSDSLLLSKDQVARLKQVEARYTARMDSTWNTLATLLTGLPDRFDLSAAYRSWDSGIDDAWEVTRQDIRRELPGVLSAEQLATLGGWAGQLWRAPGRVHIRLSLPG